jgi:hypothetical protein
LRNTQVEKSFNPKDGVPDAEVAIFYDNVIADDTEWLTSRCPAVLPQDKEPGEEVDDVVGYVKPDKIPEIMMWARDWRPGKQ